MRKEVFTIVLVGTNIRTKFPITLHQGSCLHSILILLVDVDYTRTNNMSYKVYEWCVEVVDEDGDIIESYFEESLSRLDASTGRLVLVLRIMDKINGELDRLYAYVVDGKLPERFSDTLDEQTDYKVPDRFRKELLKTSII
jgi:hypothetical protein